MKQIKVNTGSGNTLLPDAQAKDDFSFVRFFSIYLRTISQWILKILFCMLTITPLKLQSHLPVANELIGIWCTFQARENRCRHVNTSTLWVWFGLYYMWVWFSRPVFLCVNSLRPSAAYMCQWTGSALVQVMACHLLGAKLPFYQLNP